MTAAPSLPDITPLRFRKDTDLAAWLVKLWHAGFGDGNKLADLLCKPLGNAGLTFANDVDELLRTLRTGPRNKHGAMGDGAGWLVQEKWAAHLSEFGQSREAFLGSFGGVSFRDLEGDHARFHASCYGFTPNRECQAYREFVAGWTADLIVGSVTQPITQQPAAPLPNTSSFNVGDKVKLTPKFLTNTGQRGSDEAKRIWKVQSCQCKSERRWPLTKSARVSHCRAGRATLPQVAAYCRRESEESELSKMSEHTPNTPKKHSHYFKDVSTLNTVDVYRILKLFNVTDPCLQHATKKLLVAGGRGAGKDIDRDVQEAIDTLLRWQEMRREDMQVPSDGYVGALNPNTGKFEAMPVCRPNNETDPRAK